jgi:hypothetical protein
MSETLKEKYTYSLELYEKMNRAVPKKRPKCGRILKMKNDWALFEHEFLYKNELRAILKSNSREEDHIIHIILREKLNYHNEPEMPKNFIFSWFLDLFK